MTQLSYDIPDDSNGSYDELGSSPSQPEVYRPATMAGFSFVKMYGDKRRTVKHMDYKPAEIYRGGPKDPRWHVKFSFRNPDTGKFERYKVYEGINSVKDQKEKEAYAIEIRNAVNYGLDHGFNPFKEDELTFVKTWSLVQGLNKFRQDLPDRGLRKRTIQCYESVLRQMYKGLTGVLQTEINGITKAHISSFLKDTYLKNKWSNATYNNNLTFVRAIFNYLVDQEILNKNPAKSVKSLPSTTTRHRYFDDDTFEKIKQKADPVLLRFLMFLYHTGTRPNEARQLKYEHILRERKLLRIPAFISKNKKDDYVPLSDYILDNFKGEGFIFGTSINYFSGKFNKLKKELKLPKEMTLYSIKHTRAVRMARQNVPPYAIMQFFRHSGLQITMAYLKDLGTEISRESVDGIN